MTGRNLAIFKMNFFKILRADPTFWLGTLKIRVNFKKINV